MIILLDEDDDYIFITYNTLDKNYHRMMKHFVQQPDAIVIKHKSRVGH